MGVPPVKAVKAVLGQEKNRAPRAPEEAAPQDRQIWMGPPSAPPPELEEESAQHTSRSEKELKLMYREDESLVDCEGARCDQRNGELLGEEVE